MKSLYMRAFEHLISLGFSEDDSEAILAMDLDSESQRSEHFDHILECDAEDITNWIGIRPEAER